MGVIEERMKGQLWLTGVRFLTPLPAFFPPSFPPDIPREPHGCLGLLVARHGIPRGKEGPANMRHLHQDIREEEGGMKKRMKEK